MDDNCRKKNVSDTIVTQSKTAALHVTLKKKKLKSYDTVLNYLFSKNMKNSYFVAIFVNIVFPVLC